ncbi:MAG: hypothetical protein U0R78_10625 [Nocardioidaceae bacterium]
MSLRAAGRGTNMYGDTGVIRVLARRMRDQADDLRREADRLVGEAEAVWWTGWAADAMRSRARDRGAALRRTAALHDDAASALERHAAEIDRLKELIAWLERRAHSVVTAARDRLADLGRRLLAGVRDLVPEPIDQLLDRFVPPPSGHRDWLTVELPGLGG